MPFLIELRVVVLVARVGLLIGRGDGVGGVVAHLGGEPDVRVVAFLDAGGFGCGDQRGLRRGCGLGRPRIVVGAVHDGDLRGAELRDVLAGGLVVVRFDVGLRHDVGDVDVGAAEVLGGGAPLVDAGDDFDGAAAAFSPGGLVVLARSACRDGHQHRGGRHTRDGAPDDR